MKEGPWASSAHYASDILHVCGEGDILGRTPVLSVEDLHRVLSAVCDNRRVPMCAPCLVGQAQVQGKRNYGGALPGGFASGWQLPRRKELSWAEIICSHPPMGLSMGCCCQMGPGFG